MCQMIATGNFPFMLFALASACLRRPAAHRVAPLLRTRSSRRSRSSLDSSFLGRLFEATLHEVLRQLGEHAELRLVRRPALEPDPCQRDAAPKLSAFERAERRGLALLRLAERLDARDLQPVGHDAEADAVSGWRVLLVD